MSAWIARGGQSKAKLMTEGLQKAGLLPALPSVRFVRPTQLMLQHILRTSQLGSCQGERGSQK